MNDIIILVVMVLSIFGPMIVFAFVGRRALEELGKRPSQGGRVMVPMVFKLTITAAIIIGMLMVVLEVFG